MSRAAKIAVAVAAVQAMLVGAYVLVEQRRSASGEARALGTAPPQRVHAPMPPITLQARDGSLRELRAIERTTLVHFWATWCAPCRAELPSLLALPKRHPIGVVAVALDREWAAVERFFDGQRPAAVLLGDAQEIERSLGVRSLPVTYLVEPGGTAAYRFDGARDWSDPRFLGSWMGELRRE